MIQFDVDSVNINLRTPDSSFFMVCDIRQGLEFDMWIMFLVYGGKRDKNPTL